MKFAEYGPDRPGAAEKSALAKSTSALVTAKVSTTCVLLAPMSVAVSVSGDQGPIGILAARLPASTYGAGTRWSSRKIASSRAMEKALARMPVRASCLSQEAEFATNAGRRDYERQ
jgi:hypothetical protein